MKAQPIHVGIALVLGILLGIAFTKLFTKPYEGFEACPPPRPVGPPSCGGCGKQWPCGCPTPRPRCDPCPPCREPDLSKYVLKATIPPCPQLPDMSQYMLKTECPPVPDLSKYVLKSSVPTPQPVIMDCSKCAKPKGECPPCPRPRCPEVRCAEPTKCPPPAPWPRLTCPQPVVKCRAEEPVQQSIRPFLAPLSTMGFGLG